MESIIQTMPFITLPIAAASRITILITRSIIAARFSSTSEFETFQETGLPRSISSFPAKGLSWEYKFVRTKLAESDRPDASFHAIVWRASLLASCLSGVMFFVVSIPLAFL